MCYYDIMEENMNEIMKEGDTEKYVDTVEQLVPKQDTLITGGCHVGSSPPLTCSTQVLLSPSFHAFSHSHFFTPHFSHKIRNHFQTTS